jgi:hypothetical protein
MEKSMTATRSRGMADDIRTKAEGMPTSEAKQNLLNIATGYEKMAARADSREVPLKKARLLDGASLEAAATQRVGCGTD